MFWPTVIHRETIPPGGRIVAVSDIHGNLPFFQGLIKKIDLTTEDTLVVLGDILEKGQQSLTLLRHIMALGETHRVRTVCGNCDGMILRFFEGDDWDNFFAGYLVDRPESTIRQMAEELGITNWQDFPTLRQALRTHFLAEWQFLKGLPHILETDRYVFVHGGVPSQDGMDKLNAWQCMKNDYFWEQGHSFSKYLVVGHCPVTLYSEEIPSAAPLLDHNRRILSIDGGCVLKLDGQLNALLLQDDHISWAAYDGQPVVEALQPQSPSPRSLNVRWGHNQMEILRSGDEFSLCRHIETGRTISILTKYLRRTGDKVLCEDATDYFLPVSPGDHLSLCEVVEGGILAKKNGVTGWYWGDYRPVE